MQKNTRGVTIEIDTFFVKLTSPIVVRGTFAVAGRLVECSRMESIDLINRGRAVVATQAEVEGAEAGDILKSGTVDSMPSLDTWRAAAAWGTPA